MYETAQSNCRGHQWRALDEKAVQQVRWKSTFVDGDDLHRNVDKEGRVCYWCRKYQEFDSVSAENVQEQGQDR